MGNIQNISPHALVRMTLTHLWRGYDVGGVSMGRALRASLVETITNIWPMVAKSGGVHIDSVSIFELEDELARRCRIGKRMKKRECKTLSLKRLSRFYYVCLVLQALAWWYKKDEKSEYPFSSEQRIVKTLLLYVRAKENLSYLHQKKRRWSNEDLIEEGRRRFSLHVVQNKTRRIP